MTISSWLNFGHPAPPGRGLWRGEMFWLRLTTASMHCLHLPERFLFILSVFMSVCLSVCVCVSECSCVWHVNLDYCNSVIHQFRWRSSTTATAADDIDSPGETSRWWSGCRPSYQLIRFTVCQAALYNLLHYYAPSPRVGALIIIIIIIITDNSNLQLRADQLRTDKNVTYR